MTKASSSRIIAILALGFAVFVMFGATAFAALTEYQKQSFIAGLYAGSVRQVEITADGGFRVGTSTTASKQTFIKEGSCNLSQSSAGSHAATTSMQYYCPVPGATADDTVIVVLPKGAGILGSPNGGFVVNSSYATGTNSIGVEIVNLTGIASSSFAQATTSAHYFVTR